MATANENFDHVCSELLDFDEEDLNTIKKHKWWTLIKPKNAMDLSSFSHMPCNVNYNTLVGLYYYIKVLDIKVDDIYQTTGNKYAKIDKTRMKQQYLQ